MHPSPALRCDAPDLYLEEDASGDFSHIRVSCRACGVIDYLAKDYASFRRLLLDRLAVVMPDWRERNPADLGVAVVEALAYAGDYLSYAQDAVATEAYLGSARRRASVRRHARLVDYVMHDGANARTWVCFEVDRDLIGTPDKPVLKTGRAIMAQADPSLVFETLHPVISLQHL